MDIYAKGSDDMKVKDLMSTDVLCIKETTPAVQAASHMKRNNIGCLPVCDDGGFVKGILTDRDLVIRLLSKYDQGTITHVMVGEIMSTNPVTVSPKESIHISGCFIFLSFLLQGDSNSCHVRRFAVRQRSTAL